MYIIYFLFTFEGLYVTLFEGSFIREIKETFKQTSSHVDQISNFDEITNKVA